VFDDEEVAQEDDGQREKETEQPDENVQILNHKNAAEYSDVIRHRKKEEAKEEINDNRWTTSQTDCDVWKKKWFDGRYFVRRFSQFCPDSGLNQNSNCQNHKSKNS